MKIIISFLCLIVFTGCDHVRVKTHHEWMGPSVYEAYKDDISVRYYNGNCCCIAEKVIETIAEDANNSKLDWKMMADKEFQDKTLSEYCNRLRADGKE